MEITELSEQLHSNLSKLLSIQGYKNIVKRDNNLFRFDALNRMLIEMQYKGAFDLKTEEEWLIDNRELLPNVKPIYTMAPKIESVYIDCKTDKKADIADLSSEELLKALEYNIIKRRDDIKSLYVLPMYDIRQTKKLNGNKYIVNKPNLNSKLLLKLLVDITGANIEMCDESYYSKSQNTVFICKQPYKELATTVSKYIQQYLIEYQLDDLLSETYEMSREELTEYDIELIENSLFIAISSILHGDTKCDLEIVAHTDNDKLVTILNIVDSLMLGVIRQMEFKYPDRVSMDAITNIMKLKKAEVLLDIMEANNINKKLKGA